MQNMVVPLVMFHARFYDRMLMLLKISSLDGLTLIVPVEIDRS